MDRHGNLAALSGVIPVVLKHGQLLYSEIMVYLRLDGVLMGLDGVAYDDIIDDFLNECQEARNSRLRQGLNKTTYQAT